MAKLPQFAEALEQLRKARGLTPAELARELVEALSVVNNEDISIAARRDLMVIYGRLSRLGRGTPTEFPSIESAERETHIPKNPRGRRKPAKPQRRTKFREA